MKIAAILSAKDEVEIIDATVAHLRAIGVDLIIASDLGSCDGTFERLEKHRSDKDFWLFRLNDEHADLLSTWERTHLALLDSANVDWAIFLDADEYWIPATGNLKECESLAGSDIVKVDRYNVPVGQDGPLIPGMLAPAYYESLMLLVESVPRFQSHRALAPEIPWIGGVPEDKVMARPKRVGGITFGAHEVVPIDSDTIRRSRAKDLVVAHLPFTTRSRFMRKIENIRRIFRTHRRLAADGFAWHWQRWITLAEEGKLDEEIDRTVFDRAMIRELQEQGAIQSAAEVFRNRGAIR